MGSVIEKAIKYNAKTIAKRKGASDKEADDIAKKAVSSCLGINENYPEKGFLLIYDSYSRMAALIQNESQSKGIVMGEHGLSLKMELIPKNELIKENDIVVTSGLEQNIPQGLVIGKISRFLNEPNDFFQTAWLQSPIKVDNLIFVSVLISPAYD